MSNLRDICVYVEPCLSAESPKPLTRNASSRPVTLTRALPKTQNPKPQALNPNPVTLNRTLPEAVSIHYIFFSVFALGYYVYRQRLESRSTISNLKDLKPISQNPLPYEPYTPNPPTT